jgi:hypothetical protein
MRRLGEVSEAGRAKGKADSENGVVSKHSTFDESAGETPAATDKKRRVTAQSCATRPGGSDERMPIEVRV